MARLDYRQIKQLKAQNKDALLFVRLGDFYEMYEQDAVTASKELDLTLTSRDLENAAERVLMTGIPVHTAEKYIAKLVKKGFKVAITEIEPPFHEQYEPPEAVEAEEDDYFYKWAKEEIETRLKRTPENHRRDFLTARLIVANVFSDIVNKDMSSFPCEYADPLSNRLYYEKRLLKDMLSQMPGIGDRMATEHYLKDTSEKFSHDMPEWVLEAFGWTRDGLHEEILEKSMSIFLAQAQENAPAVSTAEVNHVRVNNDNIAARVVELLTEIGNHIDGTMDYAEEQESNVTTTPVMVRYDFNLFYGDGDGDYEQCALWLEHNMSDYYGKCDYNGIFTLSIDNEMGTIIQSWTRETLEEIAILKDEVRQAAENYRLSIISYINKQSETLRTEPAKGLLIKSQVEGWSDWSTETLPDNVRAAAEWLITSGYENESDVKSVFYYRQTSSMSDDFHAEEQDNDAIMRVADKYKNMEAEKNASQTKKADDKELIKKDIKEIKTMENQDRDPLFDENVNDQPMPDEGAESRSGKLTPEDYVKQADADFIKAMRDGRYPEIVDAIGNLDYSVRNVMLIKSQFPNATNVGGMNLWNYHRRSIVKDSKSIKVLAPKFGNANGQSGDEEKDKAEKATGYKINYVFDISQTQGDELKQTRCDKQFLDTHYEGVKSTIAAMAGEYTFAEGAKYNSVDYAKKQVNVKDGLSKEDTLKSMIYSVACIRIEGKDREAGKDISQGKAMFNELKESAIAHIVSQRIGLGDTKLKTIDFSGFEDEALSKVANDLNRVKSVAHGMVKRVENYVSDVRADEALNGAAGGDVSINDIFNDERVAPYQPAGLPDEMTKTAEGEM